MIVRGASKAARVVGLLGALAVASASPLANAADATDSQRVEERLPNQPAADPAGAASVQVDDSDLASIPEFDLTSVVIDGATAIDLRAAETCTESMIGQKVGAADLVGLTSCITALYRKEGFFLSRAIIPAQQVRGGVLRVRAVEGYVAAVEPAGIDQAEVDARFAHVFAQRPVRLDTFERSLLLLGDRYGHRITGSRLAADPNDPTRFTLKLEVDFKPVTWRIFGDNRGDAHQGPEQGLISLAWNGPFTGGDRLIAQYFSAPADSRALFFTELAYGKSWMNGRFATEFGASTSRNSGGGDIPDFISTSDRLYGRIILPLLRAREQSLWVKVQLDARDAEVLRITADRTAESTRVLRGSLSYTLVQGATRADIALEASHGLGALGASQNGDADLSRADSRPQFTKIRLDASLAHRLFASLDLVAAGTAQWADGALPVSEEVGIGGSRFGRAYDYSEIVGDEAVAGSLELRWTWRKLNDWLNSVQLYAYADAARIWNLGSTGVDEASLSSAGGGMRVSIAPGLLATVEVARPLTRDVASQGDRSPRVFVSLAAGW
jgi:hemolysin activation/secretion protein